MTEPRQSIGQCIRGILLILVCTVGVVWGLAFIGAYIEAKAGAQTLILVVLTLCVTILIADWAQKFLKR